MTCPSCGAALPADAHFCIECGAELPSPGITGATIALAREGAGPTCAACGALSPAGADYCIRCGSRLSAAPGRAAPSLGGLWASPVAAWLVPGALAAAIILGGMALLALMRLPPWPLILLAVGLAAFVLLAARGYTMAGVVVAMWLFSVVFLYRVPRLFSSGMLVLGLIALLGGVGWARLRRP